MPPIVLGRSVNWRKSPCPLVTVIMQESLDGNHITWMEHVTDAEYSAKLG